MARPRPFGTIRSIINEGSKHHSATTKRIDGHFDSLDLYSTWNWPRFCRLADFLRITHYELASLVLLPHRYVGRYEETNRIPGNSPHAIAYILSLYESQYSLTIPDSIENLVPKL
jgi:hypothetical protein